MENVTAATTVSKEQGIPEQERQGFLLVLLNTTIQQTILLTLPIKDRKQKTLEELMILRQ